MSAPLDKKILTYLAKKTGKKEKTIRNNLSKLSANFPSTTQNGLAQIYAQQNGFSILNRLSKEDKQSIPNNKVINAAVTIKRKQFTTKRKIIELIKYDTDNYFVSGHIKEINKTYTNGCYTSVHILARKIIENKIREVLSNKFPPTTKENKELYFNISQNRFKDFSVILKTLYDKRKEFEPKKIKVIESLYKKAKKFKDESNDATHSWYSLIERKSEIDDLNLQSMIELIKQLES
ncbi:MAG: hypothetical protein PVF83_06515 [Anaerolineales bacterium]|jgi:hypothetical protein